MINYLVTRKHSYTIRSFLNVWGSELEAGITVIPYESFVHRRQAKPGLYIFSDIERLSPAEADLYALIWERLSAEHEGFKALNMPAVSMRRFELLGTLNKKGINRFAVHNISDDPHSWRYPVFVRGRDDHRGPHTGLLHSPDEFNAAAGKARRAAEANMVVEYCDISDSSGIFRKYAAFCVGGRIIPRHIFFNRNWMIKGPELSEDWMVEEEKLFLRENPHEEVLREIFGLARINYGRIDYGMLDGAIQVWEINTNPMIAAEASSSNPARAWGHAKFVGEIVEALGAADAGMSGLSWVSMPGGLVNSRPLAEMTANLMAWYYYHKYKNRK